MASAVHKFACAGRRDALSTALFALGGAQVHPLGLQQASLQKITEWGAFQSIFSSFGYSWPWAGLAAVAFQTTTGEHAVALCGQQHAVHLQVDYTNDTRTGLVEIHICFY